MSAIITFLGGSAFRAIFGELSSWLTKRQDHKMEMERLRLQAELEAAASVRQQAAIKLQADLGMRTINVQADADVSRVEAEAFRAAMAVAAAPTGIRWVDAWSALVRPACASVALAMWLLCLHHQSWAPSEWDLSLIGAIIGYYFADRHLRRAGK